MEPVKPLLKSDKTIQTPEQIKILEQLYFQAENAEVEELRSMEAAITFTPTQEWIDKFEYVGLRFYWITHSMSNHKFHVQHYSVEGPEPAPGKLWEGPVPPKPEPSWMPQNGELIEAFWGSWYRAIYIGRDEDMDCYVVRSEKEGKYCHPKEIRKWQKTQVTLDELLSVYASVKGLTQDGVELKPEN